MRVNFGSGGFPFRDWCNIDLDPKAPHAIHEDALTFIARLEAGTVTEVYAGHFLEHLPQVQAAAFLAECYRVLVPGGRCGIVVPDIREVLARYLLQTNDQAEYPLGHFWPLNDLDAVCGLFLYGTCQESQHRWSYDGVTLGRAMQRAGFVRLTEINRYNDPRLPAGCWWQGGYDGYKPDPEAA